MEIGTEILLKRIKDCPEEFAQNDPQGIYGAGKWFSVLNAAKHSLPKEEFDAINEALEVSRKQYLLDKFNESVLKTLAGENIDTADMADAYYSVPQINSTLRNSIGVTTTATAARNSQMGMLSQQQYQHYADQQKANAASQAQSNSTPPWGKLGNIF